MSVVVKICGTTSEQDALLAVAMGADAVGFIFAPSPRQVSPAVVADIVKRLPPEILPVGVFRNESPARVLAIVNQTGLRGVQLHGNESAAQTRRLMESVQFVIKAFPAGSPAVATAESHGADAVMLDAPNPGTGQLFDWTLADAVPRSVRLVLAGGLTPENVGEAIATVQPWGVDVVSGVESSPGHKDARKLRAFVKAAKAAVLDPDRGGRAYRPPPGRDRPYDWRVDG